MTEKKPSKKYRNFQDDVRTGGVGCSGISLRGNLIYCLNGIRYKDGMSCIEALKRNLGTCRSNAKGKIQVGRTYKDESTNVRHRDGLIRSSDEVFVMKMELRGQIIQRSELNN
jgi:hypothetical protein